MCVFTQTQAGIWSAPTGSPGGQLIPTSNNAEDVSRGISSIRFMFTTVVFFVIVSKVEITKLVQPKKKTYLLICADLTLEVQVLRYLSNNTTKVIRLSFMLLSIEKFKTNWASTFLSGNNILVAVGNPQNPLGTVIMSYYFFGKKKLNKKRNRSSSKYT